MHCALQLHEAELGVAATEEATPSAAGVRLQRAVHLGGGLVVVATEPTRHVNLLRLTGADSFQDELLLARKVH